MNSKSLFIIALSLSLFFSCKDDKKTIDESKTSDMETMGDNSMNSLDWAGTYEGMLPCADCEGIKSVVTINSDKTYVTKETYMGKDDKPIETKGTFKWDDKGQKITLSDSKRHSYFVGENTLTQLDKNGNKIEGDLSNLYILSKVQDKLTGKKWHLFSFKGEEVQLEEAKAEHAFVEFLEDFTVNGYTGCNNLQGAYEVGEAQKISFSKLINTLKSCPEMETENEYLNTLNKTVHYAFENHALVMYDQEHKKLATFKPAN